MFPLFFTEEVSVDKHEVESLCGKCQLRWNAVFAGRRFEHPSKCLCLHELGPSVDAFTAFFSYFNARKSILTMFHNVCFNGIFFWAVGRCAYICVMHFLYYATIAFHYLIMHQLHHQLAKQLRFLVPFNSEVQEKKLA